MLWTKRVLTHLTYAVTWHKYSSTRKGLTSMNIGSKKSRHGEIAMSMIQRSKKSQWSDLWNWLNVDKYLGHKEFFFFCIVSGWLKFDGPLCALVGCIRMVKRGGTTAKTIRPFKVRYSSSSIRLRYFLNNASIQRTMGSANTFLFAWSEQRRKVLEEFNLVKTTKCWGPERTKALPHFRTLWGDFRLVGLDADRFYLSA